MPVQQRASCAKQAAPLLHQPCCGIRRLPSAAWRMIHNLLGRWTPFRVTWTWWSGRSSAISPVTSALAAMSCDQASNTADDYLMNFRRPTKRSAPCAAPARVWMIRFLETTHRLSMAPLNSATAMVMSSVAGSSRIHRHCARVLVQAPFLPRNTRPRASRRASESRHAEHSGASGN